jgi:hypothetical protein
MGMYSYLSYDDIEVKDLQGLKDYIERFKKQFDVSKENDYYDIVTDNDIVSFGNWDGSKIISYWYTRQVLFLRNLYKYIQGELRFTFETDEECCTITFEETETRIQVGQMNYTDLDCDDLIKGDGLMESDELSKKIKNFITIEDI